MLQVAFPFFEKEQFFDNGRHFSFYPSEHGGVFAESFEWAISSVLADNFSVLILTVRVHLKHAHITIETFSTLKFSLLFPSGPMHI